MRKHAISSSEFLIYVILIGMLIPVYVLYISDSQSAQVDLVWAGMLYTSVFILGLIAIKVKTGSFISLMTFFWVSFYLFHGSQVILNVIGMGDFTSYNIFRFFTMEEIVKATYYSTICELFFVFGMMLNRMKLRPGNMVDIKEYFSVLKNAAKILIGISAIPFIIYVHLILRAGITVGYGAINDYSNYGSSMVMKIIVIFVDVFIVSMFFMIISSYKKKAIYWISMLVILGYSLTLLALGERTEPTSLILLLMWIDSYLSMISGNISGAKRKRIIAGVLLGVLVLVFPSIMSLRHNGIISITALISDVQENGIIESLKKSIAGLGYSMMPLIEVRRMVASGEPIRYGITYIAALTNVVPFLGFAKNYANLSTWLMNQLHMSYGPGFSMAAEAYINFKDVPFTMLIYGYLISRILMWNKDELDLKKMIRGIIFVITCLTLPRRELSGRVRDIVYLVILLPAIIDATYNKRKLNR